MESSAKWVFTYSFELYCEGIHFKSEAVSRKVQLENGDRGGFLHFVNRSGRYLPEQCQRLILREWMLH
jgi:hypothetical protein